MSTPIFDIDQSGDFATGYFYGIDTAFTRHAIHGQTKEWIVSGGDAEERFVWTPGGRSTLERLSCARDPSHMRGTFYTSVGLDLCGGDTVGPFVPAWSSVVLVNDELAARLREPDLQNVRLTRATIELNQSACKDPVIYLVVLQGSNAVRWAQIRPDSANQCPYCAHGPLVCPDCGFWYAFCAKCGKEWVRLADEKKVGPSDKRIRMGPPESPNLGSIIDPSRWDGSDFMPYCIVTRRVLDIFLRVHAAPLRAQPLRVDLRGITREKKELLERAKEPLSLGC